MNLNNLTLKTQEAVQVAQQYAFEKSHPQIENDHLLYGLMQVDENVLPFLFNKLEVKLSLLKQLNETILKSFPIAEGGSQMISQKASQTLMNAVAIAKKQNDEYVATEHLLLSFLDSSNSVSKMFQDQGINKKRLKNAIEELRKGEKVTSV